MATGQTRNIAGIAPKKSAVSGKIPTGSTIGEIFSNLPDQKLWGYDGSIVFEYGTKSFLNLTGGTITGNTRITGNLSAGTIYSGSTDLYNIFQTQANTLKQKNGSVTGTTFAGNPKKATVTFATPFADNNYAVTITGEISRSWSIESKTASGFKINANANAAFTSSNVFWMAGQIGESN